MTEDGFVSHTVLEVAWEREPELRIAMQESRRSFPSFVSAFAIRQTRQTDFVVTVTRTDGSNLVPVGILVERIENDRIMGREVCNTLAGETGARAHCGFEEVVDWRYVDTFELVGGPLYRALYRRQPWSIQKKIWDHQRFLLEWDKNVPLDASFRDLIRDIANLRYSEVERKLQRDRSLRYRESPVPIPGLESSSDHRVKLRPRTVSDYTAEFGDARMVRMLHRLGILDESDPNYTHLISSAIRGNVDTTRCMLELGFNVEATDDRRGFPLEYAVKWDHEEVVALLLKFGANCNRQDNRQQTPLFHARSVAMAKLLLNAGAAVDFLNDQGETCVQHHMEHGRADIVDFLVKHGARRDPKWALGLDESQTIEKGRAVIVAHLQLTDPKRLAEFEHGQSVDYGCVLPIRSVPVQPEAK